MQPLHCGGVFGPFAKVNSARGWEELVDDPPRRSFAAYLRGAFEAERLEHWWGLCKSKLPWSRPEIGDRLLPRSAAWLVYGARIREEEAKGQHAASLAYSYGGTKWQPIAFPDWFVDLTRQVSDACGLSSMPDSCNANWYSNGADSVGWHADDEPLFDSIRNDTLIVSLSLGASRSFQFRPNEAPKRITKVLLEHGDLCTMEGLFQKHYKHCVPKEPEVQDPRINLTWRWIRVRGRGGGRNQ